MIQRIACSALVSCAVAITATVALADWSTNPAENNPVDILPQDADQVVSVTDGYGGLIVFYGQEPSGADTTDDLFARRIDDQGNLLWGTRTLVADISPGLGIQSFRAISDGQGGAFIAYPYHNGSNYRISVQHIDASGALSWVSSGVPVVTSPTGFDMLSPSLVLDGAGGVIVAWSDYRDSGTSQIDIWAQHFNSTGTRLWGAGGISVTSALGVQFNPFMIADGSGGYYLAWEDYRSTTDYDIYGQHLHADGVGLWTTNGLALAATSDDENKPNLVSGGPSGGFFLSFQYEDGLVRKVLVNRYDSTAGLSWSQPVGLNLTHDHSQPIMVSDGNDGVFVAWQDLRAADSQYYLQSFGPGGQHRWSSSGVAAGPSTAGQNFGIIVPDGFGGALIAWEDYRNPTTDIYAQRINAMGTRMWNYEGNLVAAGNGSDKLLGGALDGQGGLVMAWNTNRDGSQEDVHAQRVGIHGKLGYANPAVLGVNDFPQDQGGVVRLDWTRSYLDDFQYLGISDYTIWQRYGGAGKTVSRTPGDLKAEAGRVAKATGLEVAVVTDQLKAGWAYVDQVQAYYQEEYAYHAPTYADSSGSGIILTDFKVLAHESPSVFWESTVVAGYSIDNLAPGMPKALVATYDNPDGVLDWSPSTVSVPDLAGYRVYRSGTPGFTPSPVTFVGATPDTSFVDANLASGTWYYVVTAEDQHDNESDPSNQAELQVAVSGVGDDLPLAFRVTGAVPNPFNPSTKIHFSLAAAGHTTVEVFDARGRLVRKLVDRSMGAGRKEAVWDGRDDQGRGLPSGVYLAQVRSGAERGITKMILAK